MSDGLASKLKLAILELQRQNRELVTEIKIKEGVISDLQNRLAALEDEGAKPTVR